MSTKIVDAEMQTVNVVMGHGGDETQAERSPYRREFVETQDADGRGTTQQQLSRRYYRGGHEREPSLLTRYQRATDHEIQETRQKKRQRSLKPTPSPKKETLLRRPPFSISLYCGCIL